MSLEANKAIVQRLFAEVINRRQLDGVDGLFAPGHIHHFPDRTFQGPEGVKTLFAGIHDTFPECEMDIEDMIAEGDKVAVRFTARATHGATGKRVTYTGMDFFRIEDGKIVERRGEVDMLRLQQQLGTISSSGR